MSNRTTIASDTLCWITVEKIYSKNDTVFTFLGTPEQSNAIQGNRSVIKSAFMVPIMFSVIEVLFKLFVLGLRSLVGV